MEADRAKGIAYGNKGNESNLILDRSFTVSGEEIDHILNIGVFFANVFVVCKDLRDFVVGGFSLGTDNSFDDFAFDNRALFVDCH